MATVAVSLIGTPITQGTRSQRAHAAAKLKNADGKLDQALNKKAAAKKFQNKEGVSITSALVYNATGDPITFVTAHNWSGHVAGQTPIIIQNGQWASFYHVGEARHEGSIGAVVYNIQNYTDSMIAWNNPKKTVSTGDNTAYCEMNDPGYFSYCDWNEIFHSLRDSGTQCVASMENFTTKVSIDAVGNYQAEFYLDAA